MGIRIFMVVAVIVAIAIIFILMIAYEMHKFEMLPEEEVISKVLAKSTNVSYFDLPFTETRYYLTITKGNQDETMECSQETYYKVEKAEEYAFIIKGDRIMGFRDWVTKCDKKVLLIARLFYLF